MAEILLSEMVTILFPTTASIILSVLFGISVYKFMKNKYVPLYYHDIENILTGISFVVAILYFVFVNINFHDYSSAIAIYIFPELKDMVILTNIFAFLIRVLISTFIDLFICMCAWIFCKKKFLNS